MTPIFYKGEQIGERWRFDERLTMFLLRYRQRERYGAWVDKFMANRHPETAPAALAYGLNAVVNEEMGLTPRFGPRPAPAPAPRADADDGAEGNEFDGPE